MKTALLLIDLQNDYFPGGKMELVNPLAAAKQVERHRELLKTSRVRRSDQGRGANEPDLVVQGCPFWFELQHAADPDPIAKLHQAERDREVTHSTLLPVSIVHRTGKRKRAVLVTMRGSTWIAIRKHLSDTLEQAWPALPCCMAVVPITIDFEDFCEILVEMERKNGPT